jgi:hypothetical protein
MKFSDIGVDNLKDSSTFKKIQYFSKSNPQKLYSNVDEFNFKYKKLSDLYLNDSEPLTTSSYGLKRQHNYTSRQALLNNSNTHLDSKGFDVLMHYNNDFDVNKFNKSTNQNSKTHTHSSSLTNSEATLSLHNKLNTANANTHDFSLTNYLAFIEKNSLLAAENDSNQSTNPLKSTLNQK